MAVTRNSIRRDILRVLKNNGNKAYRPKELANKIGYRDNKAYRLFRDVLSEMDEQRIIGRLKGGRYTFKPRPTSVEGTIEVNPQMFGFVDVPGEKEDVFVAAANMGTAIDGDRVRIGFAASSRSGHRQREAEVLEIIERRRTSTVGTFSKKGHFAYVDPDDRRLVHDVYVPREFFNGATDGDKVVVSIDRFDDRRASPEGRVLEVIGPGSDPKVRVLSLALSLNVRSGFPEDVEQEAQSIPIKIPESEIKRRLDIRAKRTFTIDPVDAKDFDDAVHVETLPNGNLEVGVHIADVSHYVRRGTALDQEGYKRGTSVYLVDRVIPMLPEKLSNEVCSLRPGEDKLTFSCIMEVTPRGSVKSFDIRETVIHSDQRFTYEEAEALLQGNSDHPLAPDVAELGRLASTLMRNRFRNGSVDFDLPEIRVMLDDDGHPVDIVRKERLDAHRLVEELMLLANRTVASHIERQYRRNAFVFRVHSSPDAERIRRLAEYVRAFGYSLPHDEGRVDSRDLNQLLRHVKGSPEEYVIEDSALRAMAKAVYTTENVGHYGLGFKSYTHFTSPIRRYPDLMVHRLVKRYGLDNSGVSADDLEAACIHSSDRERAATEAERESVKLKQVEYILDHLGEQFDGIVTGVTKFGIHVMLSEPLVEGMVHVRHMDDDHYIYDEQRYTLVGEYTGKKYRPGDKVSAIVAAADLSSRKVDLVLTEQAYLATSR